MARRIGAETVEHWTRVKGGFNEPDRQDRVAVYRGCWVNPSEGSEGVGGHRRVSEQAQSIMIPESVTLGGAEDYFVWTRYPEDKYYADGPVERLHDRRGRLRANTVPVRMVE